ncbi:MAG: CHAT domain-containing protein, partial [Acidobacteriota bacterium]
MIKILFLSANPKDTTLLRLGEEVRNIKEKLRASEQREIFEFEQELALKPTDIQTYLLHHKPNIVHFSGHGSNAGEIILEDNNGRSKPVPKEALEGLFKTLKDNIRCVVLNACFSESQATAIAKSIDCVVGMSKAIQDGAAISFATSFYQALGYGRNVQAAFDLGCNQISMECTPNTAREAMITGDLGNLSDQKDIPKLITANGVDASKIYFVDSDDKPINKDSNAITVGRYR